MTEEATPLALPWYLRPIAGGDGSEAEDTSIDPGSGPADGTPAPESAEGSPEAPAVDWQERYTNLQPEYTRVSQEAARYRQVFEAAQSGDKEAQAALLAAAGYELPEDGSEDDDDLTHDERLERRLAQLEQTLNSEREQREAEAEAARQQEIEENFFSAEFKQLDPENKFGERYRDLVRAASWNFQDEEGLPSVAAAHEALQAEFEDRRKSWVQSKRTPSVPSGSSASHQPDLDDPEQRRAFIAQRLADAEHPAA